MLSFTGRIVFLLALLVFTSSAPSPAWADDDASKTEQSADHDHESGTDHGHDDEAAHGDEHGHAGDGTPVLLQEDIGASVVNLAIFLGCTSHPFQIRLAANFGWPESA